MRRPVESRDASSHADVERTAHRVVEIKDDNVANLERPSAKDNQLRMLCTMFTVLSHPGSCGDDTMRMLEDLIRATQCSRTSRTGHLTNGIDS
jgi:hypothetical protein